MLLTKLKLFRVADTAKRIYFTRWEIYEIYIRKTFRRFLCYGFRQAVHLVTCTRVDLKLIARQELLLKDTEILTNLNNEINFKSQTRFIVPVKYFVGELEVF